MQRNPITSRSLRSIGYDPAEKRLELEFRSGRVYEYEAVPSSVHEWLMRVPGKGSFVNRLITPHYRSRESGAQRAAASGNLEAALVASLNQLKR